MRPNILTKELFNSKTMFEPNSGCWLWEGAINAGGYGTLKAKGATTDKAHRLSYETFIGPIPNGMQLDHLCRVRCCVNPAHLEPVTPRENLMRGLAPVLLGELHRSITHCPKGHEYSPENTNRTKRGHRQCKICARDFKRSGYQKNKFLQQQLLAK